LAYEKFEKKMIQTKNHAQMLGIRNWIKQIRRNKHIDSQSYNHLKLKLNSQRKEELGRKIDECYTSKLTKENNWGLLSALFQIKWNGDEE
jgi:hypothetical protein